MSFSSQNPHDPQQNPQHNPQGGQPSYGGPSYGGSGQPLQQPGQHQQPPYAAPQSGYQQPGGYPQGQPGGPAQRAGQEKGFFGALFDFSFKNYITIKFASVLYIAGIVLLTLGWFIITIGMFADEGALAGLGTLIFGLIVLFIYIVLFRLMLEFYVAMVRTAQNTSILVDRGNRL